MPPAAGTGAGSALAAILDVWQEPRCIPRPDLRLSLNGVHFHDLRHAGNHYTANAGANLRELMERMGHSTSPSGAEVARDREQPS